MDIKKTWPEGPWHWVDSHDDVPVAPFVIDGLEKDPSAICIEGQLALRTVAEDYGFSKNVYGYVKGEGDMPFFVLTAEVEIDDEVVYALQAFPEIAGALIAFMGATEKFMESGEPADLKDRSAEFLEAYRAGLEALKKARAL